MDADNFQPLHFIISYMIRENWTTTMTIVMDMLSEEAMTVAVMGVIPISAIGMYLEGEECIICAIYKHCTEAAHIFMSYIPSAAKTLQCDVCRPGPPHTPLEHYLALCANDNRPPNGDIYAALQPPYPKGTNM